MCFTEMFKTFHLSACVSSHICGESVSPNFPVFIKAVILNELYQVFCDCIAVFTPE